MGALRSRTFLHADALLVQRRSFAVWLVQPVSGAAEKLLTFPAAIFSRRFSFYIFGCSVAPELNKTSEVEMNREDNTYGRRFNLGVTITALVALPLLYGIFTYILESRGLLLAPRSALAASFGCGLVMYLGQVLSRRQPFIYTSLSITVYLTGYLLYKSAYLPWPHDIEAVLLAMGTAALSYYFFMRIKVAGKGY